MDSTTRCLTTATILGKEKKVETLNKEGLEIHDHESNSLYHTIKIQHPFIFDVLSNLLVLAMLFVLGSFHMFLISVLFFKNQCTSHY